MADAFKRSGQRRIRPRPVRRALVAEGDLRPWQASALRAWQQQGRRGIVVAATGTGKTRLALSCIAEFFTERAHVVIIVPTIPLRDQWVDALRSGLGLAPSEIGLLGGSNSSASVEHSFIVGVINSGRQSLRRFLSHWREDGEPTLLVVDECHWAGAQQNARIFDIAPDASLGLSATPERTDAGLEQVLVPALGPVCFKYPLKAALDDGVLAPVRLVNLYVPLGSADEATYATLNTRIARVLTDLRSDHAELQGAFTDEVELAIDRLAATDGRARSLQRLLRERRVLLSDTPMRRRALQDVLSCGVLVGRMTIVFHERASDAEATLASVRALGIPAVADRSTDDPSVRRRAFDRFRSGNAQVLVAVRTADEGIDVPTADLAVIVNGTSTARQRIQRIGRILRPSAGEGLCVSLLARKTIEETVVGLRDCELVGSERVFHHRWPEVPVAAALMANRSTHEVDRG